MDLKRSTTALIWVTGVAVLWAGTAAARAAQRDDAIDKIWSGVYTPAQAEQGKVRFTGLCRRCHNDDLGGSERGPALRGPSFMANWEEQDLNRLVSKIRDTMPPDDPGALNDEEYLGLVSYILQANEFPSGTVGLSREAMDGIQIVRKASERPKEARSFSLVQVVGCLSQASDRSWVLTDASEPAPTRDRPSTDDELTQAGAQPPGAQTFQLVSVAAFQPDSHRGRKIAVKGLVYRAPSKDRVNVSSLQVVGADCAPR